jgi:hypothetical protein
LAYPLIDEVKLPMLGFPLQGIDGDCLPPHQDRECFVARYGVQEAAARGF